MPHRHDADVVNDDWSAARNLGIAAQSRNSVEKVLRDWQAGGKGRQVEGIEVREVSPPAPVEGHVWWREPEVGQDDDGNAS